MASKNTEIENHSIVIIGDFNPKIFHPAWFSKEGLIRESEADDAEISVVHSDITAFKLDWLEFQVTREKIFTRTTKEVYFEILRDLLIGTFDLLSHTPVRAVGINFRKHLKFKKDDYSNVISKLLPVPNWSSALTEPKVVNVTIEGDIKYDGILNSLGLTIQPFPIDYGIFLDFNNHFQIVPANSTELKYGSEVSSLLTENWQDSFQKVNSVTESILGQI